MRGNVNKTLIEPSIPTVRLSEDGDVARRQIADAAAGLTRAGLMNPRLRVVVGGDALSAPTIATLISALRQLRELGGAIELTAEHETAAAIIRLNGLDRVFAFPLVPEDDAKPACLVRKRRGVGRAMRAAAAGLAFLASMLPGTALTARAADVAMPTDPTVILARVMERNPNLSSYQSRLHVNVRLISFPFIGQHLDGSTYFKRPANYEVVFDHVPSYAKGFEKLYSDVGDPSNWAGRFVISYRGTQAFENRTDLVLHMVQRVRGMIDHETVMIDPGAWTIDQIRYDYYNGGVVTMTQHFADVGGYTMLSSQAAEIKIPHVHAVANGTYTDYQTNVAISDSVFTKKN
jgi:hypothetical protein